MFSSFENNRHNFTDLHLIFFTLLSLIQLKVDMEKEALLLPINGRSVPFHISTIKNISMPEQDRATWMRINFFIPGVALGKDVAKNVQQLVKFYMFNIIINVIIPILV